MTRTSSGQPKTHDRLAYLCALLTGTGGLIALVWMFQQKYASDLPTLLAFALAALIVSYFRVPIGQTGAQVGLDGAVLLGAVLAGGPALGGWAAFATGLVASIVVLDRHTPVVRWADSASAALLNSGRNVIATVAAWWAYRGLGGGTASAPLDTAQMLSVIVLCVVYALVRHLCAWPFTALRAQASQQTRLSPPTLTGFVAELLPLPAALLVAATFALGWSFFLLLMLVFIGLGAVMRQMLEQMQDLRAEVDTLHAQTRIRQEIEDTPLEVTALSELAYQLCQQIVPAQKFELALYDSIHSSVHIQVAVHNETKLPCMRIPITPLWDWLRQCPQPQLVQGRQAIAQLGFSLPPIDKDIPVRAAMFVPLPQEGHTPPSEEWIGGIVIQSSAVNAFTEQHLTQVVAVAAQVGPAIRQALGTQD